MIECLQIRHAPFFLAEAVPVHLLSVLKKAGSGQSTKEHVVVITFLWNELPNIDEIDNQSKIQSNGLGESNLGLPHDTDVHIETLPRGAFLPRPHGERNLANKTLI